VTFHCSDIYTNQVVQPHKQLSVRYYLQLSTEDSISSTYKEFKMHIPPKPTCCRCLAMSLRHVCIVDKFGKASASSNYPDSRMNYYTSSAFCGFYTFFNSSSHSFPTCFRYVIIEAEFMIHLSWNRGMDHYQTTTALGMYTLTCVKP
jgi:hypothetical protein